MEQALEKYILEGFEDALEKGYVQVYYQPVIRAISGQLCSFEALARWVDPVRGMLSPADFIPVLEREKLVHRLDSQVIREVCRRIRATADAGETVIPVSINLSRMDFTLCDIFEVVDQCVSTYQVPHDFLYIEITESILAEQEGTMHEVVDRFREAGYQIWMDDFGSGFSSLNMLKDYSFDELKLDMRFLSSFNQRSRRILTSVIHMAKEIDIHTLAEGVETEEQFLYLRKIGCEKVQGYYFGKPMPFEDALKHLEERGIAIEPPRQRKYYDEIGRINFLSSVPFLSQKDKKRLVTGRQLNSIPLALVELRADSFSVLFCNSAFEDNVEGIDLMPDVFHPDQYGLSFPLSTVPVRVLSILKSTRTQGEGRMLFVSKEQYYELITKCIAQRKDAFSVLVQLNNLSQAAKSSDTTQLDEGLRQIYTLFDRIVLVNLTENTVTPLYVGHMDYLTETRENLSATATDFALRWIFPEDREAYLQLWDLETLEKRIEASGRGFISGCFRYRVNDGQYNWKQILILRYRPGIMLELVHNAQEELHPFLMHEAAPDAASGGLSAELLWSNLIRSDVTRLFWKDRERRFLGVSRGFLEYYGFQSQEDVIGKTDEDLGWHIHPDLYMNDELRVIHEGITTHNIPGKCISNGENREILANKTPLYNEEGDIVGLIGSFIDRELLNMNDVRGQETANRDGMTGLLNSRGLFEHAHAFQDEYYLRNTDFMRLHISIDDLASVNRQYGFDFGDKIIAALGTEIKRTFGTTSAVGRINGYQFIVLRQVRNKNELMTLHSSIKKLADSIQEVDGIPVTLYLSVGYALYSEFEDLDQMTQSAEMRLLVDHDDHAPLESRQSHTSDFFRLYDKLPISYVVYKVRTNRKKKVTDAELFYANELFTKRTGLTLEQLLGKSVRALIPGLGDNWFEMAERAALRGETVVDTIHIELLGITYYVTVNQIIRPGYCAFTYQKLDDDGRPIRPKLT